MDELIAIATAVETQVSALDGINVELMAEELQTWTKAYKEDKNHVAAYTKLRQGQNYQDVYLTSIWSSSWNGGGSTKGHHSLVFAIKYIEGMPRCALHRPHGHVQGLGTCGPAIPLARTTR